MAVWLVRAGAHSEYETLALEQGLSIIAWSELPDLSQVTTQQQLREVVERAYPDAPHGRVSNYVGQLWSFRERMQTGDLVVLPLRTRAAIAIGRLSGPYQFRPDLPGSATHVRETEWLRSDVPRNAFRQDMLYAFGGFTTVYQITRSDAEGRINAVLEGRPDPGGGTDAPEEGLDLEAYARDQVMAYIGGRFRRHDLARLVNAVVQANGYRTQLSAPGPDGGVDIVAGGGPMGLNAPRLCVQVKSSDNPADVNVVRELQGVMQKYGADRGLLMSWGGFTKNATVEARPLFFRMRLWDAGDLVNALLQDYERLPADMQAELPLKRIWALVPEEQEGGD